MLASAGVDNVFRGREGHELRVIIGVGQGQRSRRGVVSRISWRARRSERKERGSKWCGGNKRNIERSGSRGGNRSSIRNRRILVRSSF